jgi:hypothetical protein
VPVEAQHRGVVPECVIGGVQDAVGQGADGLARVQGPGVLGGFREVNLDRGALKHAVGDEDDPVVLLEDEGALAIVGVHEEAQGKVVVEACLGSRRTHEPRGASALGRRLFM